MKWFNILRDYYTQSWRKYHSFNHIFLLSNLFTKFVDEDSNCIKDKFTVFLSIFFHDIIYTPSRTDNEEVKNYFLIITNFIFFNKIYFFL